MRIAVSLGERLRALGRARDVAQRSSGVERTPVNIVSRRRFGMACIPLLTGCSRPRGQRLRLRCSTSSVFLRILSRGAAGISAFELARIMGTSVRRRLGPSRATPTARRLDGSTPLAEVLPPDQFSAPARADSGHRNVRLRGALSRPDVDRADRQRSFLRGRVPRGTSARRRRSSRRCRLRILLRFPSCVPRARALSHERGLAADPDDVGSSTFKPQEGAAHIDPDGARSDDLRDLLEDHRAVEIHVRRCGIRDGGQ